MSIAVPVGTTSSWLIGVFWGLELAACWSDERSGTSGLFVPSETGGRAALIGFRAVSRFAAGGTGRGGGIVALCSVFGGLVGGQLLRVLDLSTDIIV